MPGQDLSSRYTLLASGGVLLLLSFLTACAEPTGTAPPAGAMRPQPEEDELWGMIPAEADLLLWADLRKLRESPWTRDSFAKVTAGEQSDARFDLVRDVDRVAFAKVPSLRDGASVLVAQGAIDREGMSRAFTKDRGAGALSAYRGAELLARGDEALAFLGKRTVISGLTVAVRAALDCNFGVARAIETEPWFAQLRAELERGRQRSAMVTALYVHLQPATREALLREMGEGGSLEDFAGRVDLGADLSISAIGVVPTEAEARSLAGRLAERLRDARVRPIVDAFGFGSVLDAVHLEAQGTRVHAALGISEKARAEIVRRMAVVAEAMAAMRKPQEEKQSP